MERRVVQNRFLKWCAASINLLVMICIEMADNQVAVFRQVSPTALQGFTRGFFTTIQRCIPLALSGVGWQLLLVAKTRKTLVGRFHSITSHKGGIH